MILKGKEGVLRIFDSTDVLHGAAPRDDATVDMVHFDGVSTYTNQTTNLEADDANIATNLIADNNDIIYIGSDIPFCRVKYLKGGGADFAAASGALLSYYFDGTDFASTLSGVSDGTFVSPDTMAQDGIISFKAPADWAIGANSFNANLDADKYYVAFKVTTSPSTDPDVDVFCPVDGQYLEIAFSNGDFTGPIGRPRPEEVLILERGNYNSKAHYINTSDMAIYEPLPISLSCLVDDTYNKDDVQAALACLDPDSARWTATGVSTKGNTQNDGSVDNPTFADANKKTVNAMILFSSPGSGLDFGWAYYETFFVASETQFAEGEEGNTLTIAGGVYGLIELTRVLANRY